MRMHCRPKLTQVLIATVFICSTVYAQLPPPTDDMKEAFPPQKHYSPYAGRNFPTQVFWGDTHVHTGNRISFGSLTHSFVKQRRCVVLNRARMMSAWRN